MNECLCWLRFRLNPCWNENINTYCETRVRDYILHYITVSLHWDLFMSNVMNYNGSLNKRPLLRKFVVVSLIYVWLKLKFRFVYDGFTFQGRREAYAR